MRVLNKTCDNNIFANEDRQRFIRQDKQFLGSLLTQEDSFFLCKIQTWKTFASTPHSA